MAIQSGNGMGGSLGNVVHYMRKGKQCARMKTANFHDAQTPQQLAHRAKMKLTAKMVRVCLRAIQIGYQASDKDSPSNEFRSFVMKNCFVTGDQLPYIDHSKVMLSRGCLVPPRKTALTFENSKATVTWENEKFDGELLDLNDKVMIVMYREDSQSVDSRFLHNTWSRSDKTVTFTIEKHNTPWHLWMFFHNAEKAVGESRKKISDSVYLGKIE